MHLARMATVVAATLALGHAVQSMEGPGLTPLPVKIAFLGDTHFANNTPLVYDLVRQQGADAVVNGGDLSYDETPTGPGRWEALIDERLGADFPYFATVGNHDASQWRGPGGYSERLRLRMERLGLAYDGDLGVESSLVFRGIQIIQTAPGLHELSDIDPSGARHAGYLRDKAAEGGAIWRIASWHRNMNEMQLGLKGCDQVLGRLGICVPNPDDMSGWEVYEAARQAGALIATAHEHSYSRSHVFSDVAHQIFQHPTTNGNGLITLVEDRPETVEDDGRTIVFVSGLGGKEIRPQKRDGDWWAARYTSAQHAKDGVLFGTFGYGGDPRLAHFYFMDIEGVLVDQFFVRSLVGGDTTLSVTAEGAGSVALEPPGERYAVGTEVTLSARPSTGDPADFVAWEGDVTGSDPQVRVRLDRDLSVRAVFAETIELVAQPGDDDDDAEEEEEDGDVDTGSDDLDLEPGSWVAVRFPQLAIPRGARILEAYVQFTADDLDSSRTLIRVRAEDRGHSKPFNEDRRRDLSRRPMGDFVTWDVGLWLEDEAGQFERTPDLSALVQQVVGRADWKAGGALSILFEPVGAASDRDALSMDEDEDSGAKLFVRYLPVSNRIEASALGL